jgi:succinate dehydrogenase / fumarate reductase cytochrome b subunit
MTEMRDPLMVGRTSDGRLVQRPLSPHLQVYRPQITTVLSILHRITGIGLAGGTLLLVCWLVSAASGDAAYADISGFLRSIVGILLLFAWTVALWYHFCNGIRHLAWDMGKGFELPDVHATGRAVLVATGVLTVLTWIAAALVM